MVKADDKLICQTVKRLRLELGDTQQEFAQRLGLAISTVVRYEHNRAPKGRELADLYRLAGKHDLHECAKILHDSLTEWLFRTNGLPHRKAKKSERER